MPRILGVDIPNEKPTWISLTYLYGIGRFQSRRILEACGVDGSRRANQLTEDEVARIAINAPDLPGVSIDVGLTRHYPQAGVLAHALGYVAPPVEFIGGVCLLLGLATRYASLVLLLFVIIATFSSHRYWAYLEAQQANQSSHFWKNMTMKGGLLFLFITGAGRYALDRMLARR